MSDSLIIVDAQAEAGVIATLLYHPEFILHTDYLKAKYFYDTFNGSIYWAIQKLYQSGVDNIDAINLMNVLNGNAGVRKVVEQNNLTNMNEFIELAQYAARHTIDEYKLLVKTVVTMAYKREMVKATKEIQQKCFNIDADLAELNKLVGDRISGVTEQFLTGEDITMFGERVDDIWDAMISKRTANGCCGIPSKFPLLNDYLTYENGSLTVVAARMKQGKSALLMNEVIHKLLNHVPTVYFDTEMPDEQFFVRMVANLTKIGVRQIKNGDYSQSDEVRIEQAKDWIRRQPFVHVYLTEPDLDHIYCIVKTLQYKMNLGFVVYDYIKTNDGDGGSSTSNILGKITDFLKNKVAGELNLPVLAAAQLSRINMLADSDRIERFCDASLFWKSKDAETIAKCGGLDCGNYMLQVHLNRNGAQMDEEEWIDIQFVGDTMTIEQAKKQHTPAGCPFDQ